MILPTQTITLLSLLLGRSNSFCWYCRSDELSFEEFFCGEDVVPFPFAEGERGEGVGFVSC